MQHDKNEESTKASTTMISTTDKEEEDQTAILPAGADSDDDQMDNEDDPSAKKLYTFGSFSRAFVRTMSLKVEDVGANDMHRQNFLDVLQDCFVNTIRLSNAIEGGQGPVNTLMNSFLTLVSFKASRIAESVAQTENLQEENQEVIDKAGKDQTKILMDEVVALYASMLAAWKKTSGDSAKSHHQARALIEFALKLRSASNEKLSLNAELTEMVLWLGDSLFNAKNAPKSQVMHKIASEVYNNLLKGQADAKSTLMSKSDSLFCVLELGLLLSDMPGDSDIINCLSEKSDSIVFSDKCLTAFSDVHFFRSFYANLSEEVLLQKVLPAAQVASRRNEDFCQNVAYLVEQLTCKLSCNAATQLITEVLSTESLSNENGRVVSRLMTSVCKRLDVADAAAFEETILREFLLKASKEINGEMSVAFTKKLRVAGVTFDCIKALGEVASDSFVKDAALCLLTLIIGEKEDSEISDAIKQVFKSDRVANCDDVWSFIESNANKLTSATQVNFVKQVYPESASQAWKDSVSDATQRTLMQQNFQSTANYSLIFALLAMLNKFGKMTIVFNQDAQVSFWLSGGTSVASQQSFFTKNPNLDDTNNHVELLSVLLYNEEVPLTKDQTRILTRSMLNYMTNQVYTYRASAVHRAVQRMANRSGATGIKTLLVSILNKQTEIFDTPVKNEVKEDLKKEVSTELHCRLFNSVMVLTEELYKVEPELSYDTFTLILQNFCHPQTCRNQRDLRKVFNLLLKTIGDEKMSQLFESNSEQLLEQFLKRRTGVLSDNLKVRVIAKNILVLLSWTGLMDKILPAMVPVFEYKPIQLLNKMEALLNQEFDRIGHYDLMFYSEMSKDLVKIFNTRDETTDRIALRLPESSEEEESKDSAVKVDEPVVKAEPEKPVDLATLLKRKKAGKDKKKAKKASKAKAAPAKAAAASAPAQQEAEAPVETKEERNKNDRKQLLSYVEKLRTLKAMHVSTCQEILLWGNQCEIAERLSYQDKTLNFTINSLLKLLNLSATKFSSQNFLNNLLKSNPDLPFFKIKTPIITCLMAIAQNRLTLSTTQEFQNCLVFLDETANFSDMEGGYLKLTLTIANYVLRDPSVNLSVKEIGLQVTQSILDTNTEVETIDIVRLTINMLKTNYISSNLGLFIRKLMQRCERLEIAMLLQRLFEYQPVPRKTLLTEILNYDEPLFCPVWLQTQLWVLLSDEELSSLARKIWNKFGFYLQPEAVSLAREKEDLNMFHYLRSPNYNIFDLTVRSTAAAIELFQYKGSTEFLQDLIDFYNDEWNIIEQLAIEACEDYYDRDQKVQCGLIADERVNRIAIPKILKDIARFVSEIDLEKVLTFLTTNASLDQNKEIADAALTAATEIIEFQGAQHGNSMLAILEKFIKDASFSKDAKTQACILLARLAPFLENTAAKKLHTTVETLFELSSNSQSETVRKAVSKCIPQLSKYMPDKAKIYLREQLQILQESRDEACLKGTAYNAAGLFKAKGMKCLQEMDVLNTFGNSYFQTKRSDHVRKLAALNLFETLSFSMGRSFELYIDLVFPHILSSISDQKEVVREAATGALTRIMANFTNYAIKQALPQFLNQLETDNWRSKISTVEALGNMAYCAPKQISGFLPQIVKGLREVMNDTHEKVHDAAIQAISKIGSVIKCPEVGDMLELIIQALSNTTKYLKEALNLLLETSFVHKIDAPSLSLLVPLLDSGLMMHDNHAKQMAAQLMGNICALTSDPSDLLPYMSILMPAIKNSLFDAIPEIRASSAKALGSLGKGLGITNSEEMLGWLREHLNTPTSASAERLGAAQGFAELISAHGKDYFDVNVEEVVLKAKDSDGEIREAYRSVLLFLAGSYEDFVKNLDKLIPLMITGLTDDKDEVRKVSMRNVKVCIKQFGKREPMGLIEPIMKMMFHKDSRVRASSSILMYQLVKELDNDIIKSQPKFMEIETKHKILSSMFILRHDQIDAVKSQAGQIWKSLIDNQLFILRQVIDTLIEIVFQIIQSKFDELQEMGLSCMRGLVEKFGEKIVNRALDIFEDKLNKVTDNSHTIGICRVMFNMVSAAPHRLLQQISPRMVEIMSENLSCEEEEVRRWSTKVFITMFQRQPDKAFIDPTLEKVILFKLKEFVNAGRQDDAQILIVSLKQMIYDAKDLRIQDKMLRLCEISNKETTFSIAQAQILGALAPTIAGSVFHKRNYTAVMTALEAELNAPKIDDKDRIEQVLIAYAELMSHVPQIDFTFLQDELLKFCADCRTNAHPEFYLGFMSIFCEKTECNIEAETSEYLENVLKYMNHPDPKLVEKVVKAMNAIFKRVSKETQFTFVPKIKESIEEVCVQFVGNGSPLLENPLELRYQKKVPHLSILSFSAGIKCIVEVAQAGIMQGSIEVRTAAAFCFKYVLDFAPELQKGEIVKICGALIRVANDRFPQELKQQIYYALRFIQTKGGPSAKGFQVNMQTTYTKALGDAASTLSSRRIIMENLLLLIQNLPRIDPIVKELNALIDGVKIDGDQKTTVSECLALIIRQKGKAISSAISQTIYKTMTDIMSESQGGNNDRILSNCASALAFLSAYASDASQMQALFTAFDEGGEDCIILPLKFAILINGNDSIDKSKLVSDFQAMLVERLTDTAGFQEIDDDPSPIVGEDDSDGLFHFKGVLDTLAYVLDKFARRSFCQAPDSAMMKMVFATINQSGIFKKLHQEDDISQDSFKLLCNFAALIPVKPVNGAFTEECAETLRDILNCIQKFYLDHVGQALQDTQDALVNILQLNYDNYTDYSDNLQIAILTKPKVKAALDASFSQGVVSDDMKMYSLDILQKKK